MLTAAAVLLALGLYDCGGASSPRFAPTAFNNVNVEASANRPESLSGRLTSAYVVAPAAPRMIMQSKITPIAASGDLLYVSNVRTVAIYSYPHGALVGTLKGFYSAQGECVDKKGDVFITNLGTNEIFEYAHGSKTRMKTLAGEGGPTGCSVDPLTGNLAVSNLTGGSLAVYKNAAGKPKLYKTSALKEDYWCTYDGKGNVFVDGEDASSAFALAELATGSKSLVQIKLNQSIGFPGGVEWDGKHVAVGDQDTSVIYQFVIAHRRGTRVGRTALGSGAMDLKQFWIQGETLIAPNVNSKSHGRGDVLFFDYPAGGRATKKIVAGLNYPTGLVVSPGSFRR